jgi:hypothetical protein
MWITTPTNWIKVKKPLKVWRYRGLRIRLVKVAISNGRILKIDNSSVTFSYKDYRQNNPQKQAMVLKGHEFLRRFSQHILPYGFRKVRSFGFNGNASKAKSIKVARQSLHVKQKELLDKAARRTLAKQRLFKKEVDRCLCCKKGEMVTVEVLSAAKAPPSNMLTAHRLKELFLNN